MLLSSEQRLVQDTMRAFARTELFPQFIDPSRGSVLVQGLVLALTQFVIVVAGDSVCVFAATGARGWFARRPGWSRWSKRALAGVFAALAARLAVESRT